MADILVVDDENQMRKFCRVVLEQEGHSVLEAPNGVEALKLLTQATVHVMLADILMPEKDGLELIREARKAYPDLKIIAVSGGGHDGPTLYLDLAKHFKAHAVLMKPFAPESLTGKVSEVLGVLEEEVFPVITKNWQNDGH